jgi:hypothetical protein
MLLLLGRTDSGCCPRLLVANDLTGKFSMVPLVVKVACEATAVG